MMWYTNFQGLIQTVCLWNLQPIRHNTTADEEYVKAKEEELWQGIY